MSSLDMGYMNCLDKASKQVVELQEVLRRADLDNSSEPQGNSTLPQLKRQALDTDSRLGEEKYDEVREPSGWVMGEEEHQIQVSMNHQEHRAGASCVGHVVAHAVVLLLLMWRV